MKFTEDRLARLHRVVKEVNKLDIGAFTLPERIGIFDLSGNIEAVLIWDDAFSKYSLDLISEEEKESIQAHKDQVKEADEVKDV